jgi:hypothetical protein
LGPWGLPSGWLWPEADLAADLAAGEPTNGLRKKTKRPACIISSRRGVRAEVTCVVILRWQVCVPRTPTTATTSKMPATDSSKDRARSKDTASRCSRRGTRSLVQSWTVVISKIATTSQAGGADAPPILVGVSVLARAGCPGRM